ncbi:MAG TPA: hypothetical protein VJR03_13115 [Nitrospira sp.]|nr:hypothetical protein [Nitrospira sp.]
MASSPEDWELAHSLWLQRRATRRAVCRTHWRSDWTPLALVLLLLGLLILLSVFLPSRQAVDRERQAAQDEKNGSQRLPVVGVLTEP